MRTRFGNVLQHLCRRRREDDLLIALAIYVVCFVLFAR